MKIVLALLLILPLCAQAQWAEAYAQTIANDTTRVDSIVLVREDGTVFGRMAAKTAEIDGQTYIFVIWNDSALVGSRMAHDDAIVKSRKEDMNYYQRQAAEDILKKKGK